MIIRSMENKDRIMLRAERSDIFEYGGIKSSDLTKEQADEFFETIGSEIYPLITFWNSKDKWTVMTEDNLYSKHNGNFVSCSLDDIQDDIEGVTSDSGEHRRETKRTTEILYLKRPQIFVWAPAGEGLHGFWSILRYCRPTGRGLG